MGAYSIDQECEEGSFMNLARDYLGELVSGSKQGRCDILQRMRALAYTRGPRAKIAAENAVSDLKLCIRQTGPLKVSLLTAVIVVGVVAAVSLITFLVLLVSATANAALLSLIMSVSLVGFLMATFFTSLTAVYVGALLAVGLIVSAVTFFTICGMIAFAGWFTFTWGVWNMLRRVFLVAKKSIGFADTS